MKKNIIWEIEYEYYPSNGEYEGDWMDGSAKVLGTADPTQSIERVKRRALKDTWPECDEDGKETKKRVTVTEFRLVGLKKLEELDLDFA